MAGRPFQHSTASIDSCPSSQNINIGGNSANLIGENSGIVNYNYHGTPDSISDDAFLETLFSPNLEQRRIAVELPFKGTYQWILDEACYYTLANLSSYEKKRIILRELDLDMSLAESWRNLGNPGPRPEIGDCALPRWTRHGQGIFWLWGKPGSGKSTMMKFLLQEPKHQQGLKDWAATLKKDLITINHFFWAAGSLEMKSLAGLARSLLYQLLDSDRSLIPVLFSLVERSWATNAQKRDAIPNEPFWTFERLKQALKSALKRTASCVYVHVDGLDECQDCDPTAVATFMKSLLVSPSVKMMCSSRWSAECEKAFSQSSRLAMHLFTFTDVVRYITRVILDDSDCKDIILDDTTAAIGLVLDIAEKSDGIFAWLRPIMQDIVKACTDLEDIQTVRQHLGTLPEDMMALYRRLLDRIHPKHRAQAALWLLLMRLMKEHTHRQGVKSLDGRTMFFHQAEKYHPDQRSWFLGAVSCDLSKLDAEACLTSRKMMRRFPQFFECHQINIWNSQDGATRSVSAINPIHKTVIDFVDLPEIIDLLQGWSHSFASVDHRFYASVIYEQIASGQACNHCLVQCLPGSHDHLLPIIEQLHIYFQGSCKMGFRSLLPWHGLTDFSPLPWAERRLDHYWPKSKVVFGLMPFLAAGRWSFAAYLIQTQQIRLRVEDISWIISWSLLPSRLLATSFWGEDKYSVEDPTELRALLDSITVKQQIPQLSFWISIIKFQFEETGNPLPRRRGSRNEIMMELLRFLEFSDDQFIELGHSQCSSSRLLLCSKSAPNPVPESSRSVHIPHESPIEQSREPVELEISCPRLKDRHRRWSVPIPEQRKAFIEETHWSRSDDTALYLCHVQRRQERRRKILNTIPQRGVPHFVPFLQLQNSLKVPWKLRSLQIERSNALERRNSTGMLQRDSRPRSYLICRRERNAWARLQHLLYDRRFNEASNEFEAIRFGPRMWGFPSFVDADDVEDAHDSEEACSDDPSLFHSEMLIKDANKVRGRLIASGGFYPTGITLKRYLWGYKSRNLHQSEEIIAPGEQDVRDRARVVKRPGRPTS